MSTSIYKKTYTSFSGSDIVPSMDIVIPDKSGEMKSVTIVIGALQTISYSIHMDKRPVRSIGSVNAKDYVFGPRTIAGSLVFAMFDKHVAHEVLAKANSSASSDGQMIIMDELPPFNITLSMANEYGQQSRVAIYGVRIINEGNVISINDVYTENTYQFVATDIEYLNNGTKGSSGNSSNAWALSTENRVFSVAIEAPKPVIEDGKVDLSRTMEPSGSAEQDIFIDIE